MESVLRRPGDGGRYVPMTNLETQSEQATPPRRSRWRFAMTTTSLVAFTGFVVAVHQFALKYVWDQHAHTRTLGGLLFMSLGLLGLYLPFRLIRRQNQFAAFSTVRQWFGVLGVPLLYVLTYAACIGAALKSDTLILPRPFAPTAVVTYDGSQRFGRQTNIRFSNAIREHHPGSGGFGHDADTDDTVERFNASFTQVFLGRENQEMGRLDGETRVREDGRVEIAISVDARERLQFAVRGLHNVAITRNGESISEFDAKSGKYKIVIVGRPKNGT